MFDGDMCTIQPTVVSMLFALSRYTLQLNMLQWLVPLTMAASPSRYVG